MKLLLTRLRLRLGHLNEHKFSNNIRDCVNPLCPCSLKAEPSSHFFLHCHYQIDIWKTLFQELHSVDDILNQSDYGTVKLLLYGCTKLNFKENCKLLESAIKFTLKSERFNGSMI